MTPFSIVAALNLPGDAGLPADQIPFNGSSSFGSAAESVLNLTGAGTKAVGLGSIATPGIMGLLIKVDPNSSGQPVNIVVNGSLTPLEISPGGGLLYFNPQPVAGITSLSVTYATSCVVRIWALGA